MLYTICKQAGEQFCRRYAELFGLSAVAGRLGTAYGPMERPTGSRQTMSQVTALLEAGLAGRSLRIYGVERFRDVCFIDDVAEAFVSLTLAPTLTFPIYNVSAGTAHRLSEIARQVAELVPTLAWQAVDDPAVADLVVHAVSERGGLDLTRLQQDVGFTPRYSLDEGLRRSLAWLRNMQ
ncbi:MAG: NAD-dependent epimerase/dehydratase family protein [Chloroflexaceae bacterium]|nr:NAD-dependent epimerase/dehydratase family protein [Chloroflexaceae bacterium]